MSADENTHKITVQASTEHLSEVRNFVSLYAVKHGVSEEQIDDIRLAVDEAYTNIIKHAYQYDETQTVKIIMGTRGDEFYVSLIDQGRSFDPTQYQEPDVQQKIKSRERGGVGVLLMKKLMDRIEYSTKEGENEIRMFKKL